MSPLQISMMLHHYVTPAVWDGPRPLEDTPGFSWLRDSGMLARREETATGDSPYYITDKGRAYVALLVATPLPAQCWVDPRTATVIESL